MNSAIPQAQVCTDHVHVSLAYSMHTPMDTRYAACVYYKRVISRLIHMSPPPRLASMDLEIVVTNLLAIDVPHALIDSILNWVGQSTLMELGCASIGTYHMFNDSDTVFPITIMNMPNSQYSASLLQSDNPTPLASALGRPAYLLSVTPYGQSMSLYLCMHACYVCMYVCVNLSVALFNETVQMC